MLVQDPVRSKQLNHWADDLSCALFGLANVVTAMYYLIDVTNGKDALVEGGQIQRPAWLGFSVHVFNSLVAWADILCAHPRSFSKTSGRLSVGIVAFYTCWILICSHFNGAFPYPILNQLPWPMVSFVPSAILQSMLMCTFPAPPLRLSHGVAGAVQHSVLTAPIRLGICCPRIGPEDYKHT